MAESTPQPLNAFDPDARFRRLETALYRNLIDTFRHPFTESKGRVRRALMDVIWAGRSAETDVLGREYIEDMLTQQCEDHITWETEVGHAQVIAEPKLDEGNASRFPAAYRHQINVYAQGVSQ